MTYRLATKGVTRTADDLAITRDMPEWQEYRAWLKAGNVPEPMPPAPPPPPLSAEEIIARLTAAIQKHLDDTARTRGYDGILSACSYATDTNPPFALEAQACVDWRSAVWLTSYALMAEVQSGQRPIPTVEELIALLPQITWPA
jgi:hypothetical protein